MVPFFTFFVTVTLFKNHIFLSPPPPFTILSLRSVAKHQKIEWGPFEEKKFRKKSRSAEKNWKGLSFGLAGYGMLRGKTRKTGYKFNSR